ncbi:MAG: hypothetical protein J6Q02_01250, partial [Lachnospiraceae bacterium]|nr:hypothetical protein [Lachnospiraceae bacterium]
GVEIAMFGEQSSLRTITVIHWSVELWGYVIDFPSGLDVSGQIGIITVATLLLVFSKISPHFKFTQINECSSLKAFFVKYKTSETVCIEEILKAWGIRLE